MLRWLRLWIRTRRQRVFDNCVEMWRGMESRPMAVTGVLPAGPRRDFAVCPLECERAKQAIGMQESASWAN
jgi:hypothetical protein